jgi:hypothetical protein
VPFVRTKQFWVWDSLQTLNNSSTVVQCALSVGANSMRVNLSVGAKN